MTYLHKGVAALLITAMSGTVCDQSALRALLGLIWDTGATIVNGEHEFQPAAQLRLLDGYVGDRGGSKEA